MKTTKLITALFSSMFIAIHVQAQGSLTPPGAPAPSMKTLEQVEPRTPISSLPYTITNSGSYYVTASLSSTGHGVVVTASGVTLDLMGFTISGDMGSVDYGIFLDGATNGAIRNVVVLNGIVRNFGQGVRAEYTQDSRFERLTVASNSQSGLYFSGASGQCNGNTIADCTISENTNYGVLFDGPSGQCSGNTLADCTISGNASFGVRLNGSAGKCTGNTLADCTIRDNGYGVYFIGNSSGQCDGNTLADCTISDNSSYGVYFYGFGGQCNDNSIAGCMISGNGDYGVYLYGKSGECNGNTLADCTISGNGFYGIYLSGESSGQCMDNSIVDCTIQKNWLTGIYLYYADRNRVEGNHVARQTGATTYGISSSGTTTEKNLIVRNMCMGQTFNFIIGPLNTYGPIVSSSGGLSATDPWANFDL